jgi:CBS-domain-containing membrane protein
MHLKEIMATEIISLSPTDSIGHAREAFTRYGFRALPVIEENEVIQG